MTATEVPLTSVAVVATFFAVVVVAMLTIAGMTERTALEIAILVGVTFISFQAGQQYDGLRRS